eukprot:3815962-Rhodomonas_salina.1
MSEAEVRDAVSGDQRCEAQLRGARASEAFLCACGLRGAQGGDERRAAAEAPPRGAAPSIQGAFLPASFPLRLHLDPDRHLQLQLQHGPCFHHDPDLGPASFALVLARSRSRLASLLIALA